MGWLTDYWYWWVVLLVLSGMLIGSVKALRRVDATSYLKNRPELPTAPGQQRAMGQGKRRLAEKNNLSLARR